MISKKEYFNCLRYLAKSSNMADPVKMEKVQGLVDKFEESWSDKHYSSHQISVVLRSLEITYRGINFHLEKITDKDKKKSVINLSDAGDFAIMSIVIPIIGTLTYEAVRFEIQREQILVSKLLDDTDLKAEVLEDFRKKASILASLERMFIGNRGKITPNKSTLTLVNI